MPDEAEARTETRFTFSSWWSEFITSLVFNSTRKRMLNESSLTWASILTLRHRARVQTRNVWMGGSLRFNAHNHKKKKDNR
jgi:hypothetical protein